MTSYPRLRALQTGVLLAVGGLLVGAVLFSAATEVLGAVGVAVERDGVLGVALGTVLLQGVAFGGTALAYLRFTDRGLSFLAVRRPDRRDVVIAAFGFVALLVVFVGANELLARLGLEAAQNELVEAGRSSPVVFLVLIPLSFLLVGPGEELLFRGVIQRRLTDALGTASGVSIASAIFAAIHAPGLTGPGTVVSIAVVFALALVLGVLYEHTDTLVVPAVVHGAYNAVQFALAYLAVTGALGSG